MGLKNKMNSLNSIKKDHLDKYEKILSVINNTYCTSSYIINKKQLLSSVNIAVDVISEKTNSIKNKHNGIGVSEKSPLELYFSDYIK
jgi:Ni2+-binding GTPase involved in maturation of urease and hydrogenase